MSVICNPIPNPNPTPIDLNTTHIFSCLTENFDGSFTLVMKSRPWRCLAVLRTTWRR